LFGLALEMEMEMEMEWKWKLFLKCTYTFFSLFCGAKGELAADKIHCFSTLNGIDEWFTIVFNKIVTLVLQKRWNFVACHFHNISDGFRITILAQFAQNKADNEFAN
jgi:hypothetical protein